MIGEDRRKAIFLLHQEGMELRVIARRLHVSRNTVRAIIAQGGSMSPRERADRIEVDADLLRQLYQECDGFIARVHEKLLEAGIRIAYPTLTHRLRALGISPRHKARCDERPDEPGVEMQHDTSMYRVALGERSVRVIASLLYLRYSKRRYLKFYPAFNRFRMKCFFHESLSLWGFAARQCIIDNTNLARLRGTGRDAVITPEMAAFAKSYGFEFLCHAVGHPNRKAGEERGFYTVETNFFPGRTFQSLEDLNEQALEWATVRMEQRVQGKTGVMPAKAFEHERTYLQPLPPHLPAPYLLHERDTDQYGYAAFDSNYYWVPGTRREALQVLEYADRIKLYRERVCLAEQLASTLRYLRLGGLLAHWDEHLKAAAEKRWSHATLLTHILQEEYRLKHENARRLRLRSARIPEMLVIETFPFERQPKLNKKKIMALYDSMGYIEHGQNILWLGGTGVGKTGLATSFLIHAINRGHTGRFVRFPDLVAELYRSLADHSEEKVLKSYAGLDCLAIDEVGYIEVEPVQVGLFFTLMQQRHKKKPTLITSNLGFSDWRTFLKNDHLTAALIDRLTETSHIFNMKDCVTLRAKLSQEP